MAVKRRDLPADPQAAAIVKVLDTITATGQRPNTIFSDWLELVEGTLDMLPTHARSLKETGKPAEDPPDVAQVWEQVRSRYEKKAWVFERFSEAFGLLMNAAHPPDETLSYQDVIGSMYMSWGYPSSSIGQFFTPWPVARMMAEMVSDGGADVHARLKAAIDQSPIAQAFLVAGCILEGQDGLDWFLTRVIPAAIEHYQPVTVNDPAVGSGILLLAHASTLPAWMVQMGLVQYSGCDVDSLCVRMARVNFKLYGLNGFGLKCALELSQAELAALPEPHATAYAEAQQAHAVGDTERVAQIATHLRQLSLFPQEVKKE
jgi:hypothetical protein